MKNDPIVAAVRKVREELARQCNFDVHEIFEDMRRRESEFGDRLVRQPSATQRRKRQAGLSAVTHEEAAADCEN